MTFDGSIGLLLFALHYNTVPSFVSWSRLLSSQHFGRCPPLQIPQVVCPILALLRGQVCHQGPSWAPALDRTPHQALFTVWWDPALDLEHTMHLTACRDKVITLRTACILCTRYSVPTVCYCLFLSLLHNESVVVFILDLFSLWSLKYLIVIV